MNGIEALVKERASQIVDHGYEFDRDREWVKGELLAAAECYMIMAKFQIKRLAPLVKKHMEEPPKEWPGICEWKPSSVAKNNLKKAGALIAAEWDRLDMAGL
jgi:hypothetical protein